ncbi:Panacea domain-containing protein [Arthrobacter celericrescens]|uniref:Panacea domain-containing protein n=1 Tax=Arthrobacter celericrescens TaxID=2320851 RepID=UPI000EA09C1D|nr:type II toxin-antitoxin system antitoxin SocA domain-containing protein [Arthrobacter celericrescens]
MVSVHDVAAYILKQCGAMSTMKLQKLCYYSQGWSLAWDEKPLFGSRIEAWANGPVVYDLYQKHRGRFTVDSWPDGNPNAIGAEECATIDAVLAAYGQFSGQQLSDLTHSERPWKAARKNVPSGARCQVPVSLDIMQDFFGGIAAEQAAATQSI